MTRIVSPNGQVLKFNSGSWINSEDATGISSAITTNQITDGTMDSNHFVADSFHINMFSNASLETNLLLDKNNIVELEGDLNFGQKEINNLHSFTINDVNLPELYRSCENVNTDGYLLKFTAPAQILKLFS